MAVGPDALASRDDLAAALRDSYTAAELQGCGQQGDSLNVLVVGRDGRITEFPPVHEGGARENASSKWNAVIGSAAKIYIQHQAAG